MAFPGSFSILLSIGCILLFASPAHGFGAGNIAAMSAIEGTNWRHGDIEDTLLQLVMSSAAGGRNFDKMAVARYESQFDACITLRLTYPKECISEIGYATTRKPLMLVSGS